MSELKGVGRRPDEDRCSQEASFDLSRSAFSPSLRPTDRRRKPLLHEDDIRQAAQEYFDRTARWPTKRTVGDVPGMPGQSWGAIHQAGKTGSRGLERGRTLAKILLPLQSQHGKKSQLTEAQIISVAQRYFEISGEWPTRDTRAPVPGMPLERWSGLDEAGRRGKRGLQRHRTLAKILEKVKHPARFRLPSVHAIQVAVEAFFRQHHRWPTASSKEPVPGMPGEKWRRIDYAVRAEHSRSGLAQQQSLAAIVKPLKLKAGYVARRNIKMLNEQAVQEAAITLFTETGIWPTVDSAHPVPGMPTETWQKINNAGRVGYRGLAPGRTLARIIKPCKETFATGPTQVFEPVTPDMVQNAALEFFRTHQRWPHASTKEPVPGVPPSVTWKRIDSAGRVGCRGLERGQTLAHLIEPLKAQFGRGISRRHAAPLDEKQIAVAATSFFKQLGKWPTAQSKEAVPGMPGESWAKISNAGQDGWRGLTKGRTLAVILAPLKRASGSRVKERGGLLDEERIVEAARIYHIDTGRWPTQASTGAVPGLPQDSWRKINAAGYHGYRGLHQGRTLRKILAPLKQAQRAELKSRSHRKRADDLSEEMIIAAAMDFFNRKGRWPTSDTVEPFPGAPKDTWKQVNAAGRAGRRGLQKGRTLPVILAPVKREFDSLRSPTPIVTTQAIQNAARRFFYQYARWPHARARGEVPGLPGIRWGGLDKALREGLDGLPQKLDLTTVLSPLRFQATGLGSRRMPEPFEVGNPPKNLPSRLTSRALGAMFIDKEPERFVQQDILKGLSGVLLSSLYPADQIIPQWCISAQSKSGYIGNRVDYRAGSRLFDVYVSGDDEEVSLNFERHWDALPPAVECRLILLSPGPTELLPPYRLFEDMLEESDLGAELQAVWKKMQRELGDDAAEHAVFCRNYLHGLVLRANTVVAEARLRFLSQQLREYIVSEDGVAWIKSNMSSTYSPLLAHFHHDGELYQSRVPPNELVFENASRYSMCYRWGDLVFADALTRDIAVMCELVAGSKAEGLVSNSRGIIRNPVFHLPSGISFAATSIRELTDLLNILPFQANQFEAASAYLAVAGYR